MAESGLYTFQPEIADLLRESFERAQIKASDIDYGRLESAVRSANFVLVDLHNQGCKAYELELVTETTTVGMTSFTLPQRIAKVLFATLSRDGIETPLVPISLTDYEAVPKKDVEGRPCQYWDDSTGTGNGVRSVYIWPAGENTTDIIRMWGIRRPMVALETGIAQTPGISFEWQDAFCDGLSVRLAQKFNQDALRVCQAAFADSFKTARLADRDRAPARFRVSPYRGRRGR
jgi:hypothetical protein